MKKITKKRAKDSQYIYDPGYAYGGSMYPNGGNLPSTISAPTNQSLPSLDSMLVYNQSNMPMPINQNLSPKERLFAAERAANDKYYGKESKLYPDTGERTGNFTQGKLRGGSANKELLNDLVAAADKAGVPRDQMFALAANETIFGQGYRQGKMSAVNKFPGALQQNVISSWDLDQAMKPANLDQFLYNKGLPYMKLIKDKRGYAYGPSDPERFQNSLDSALNVHPEWIDQYTQSNKNVVPKGDINYFDLTANALRDKGLRSAAFNPGDPHYADKIEQARQLVNKEPELQPYLNQPRGGSSTNKTKMEDGGGLSRDEDYGSKSRPYPMVKSNDFAGGGRSYPIPTRADAIDALRLAGLHGRSDVKAKVYKKYPDLRKEWGGPTNLGALQSQGYDFNPNQTYMMDDGSFNSPSSIFEYGGYMEKFNEGSAFCDPTPNYTRNMSNGELGGRYGIPPKVYASGGNVDYNTGNGRTGHFIEGSMFEPQYTNYVHNWHGQAYPNIPPKVYDNGGTAPMVEPNRAFTASPFPYDSMYTSNYRSNSYVDTFANGGDIGPSTSEYGLYTYDTGINPTDYMSDEYPIAKSGIHINPKNRGKFTETKRRTGKTTEELTHSSNPLTRKRAIFAQNARKWHHEYGGMPGIDSNYSNYGYNGAMAANGMGINNPFKQYSTQEDPIYYQGNNDNASSLPINSPLQSGSQDLANSAGTSNNNRGGMSTSFTLGTLGPIMAASALAGNISNQQSNAKYSAMDKRRNIQAGPYYNPYGYGDGSGMLANGGRMNDINATRGHKASMTLADAMDIIRQHGYDIEVND